MRHSSIFGVLFFAGVGLAMAPPAAVAQTDLPQGRAVSGTATADAPVRYRFAASSAGVLTVAVQGAGDLVLSAMDEDGQPLPGGSSDQDLGGNRGVEMLSLTITEPGGYLVQVRDQSGERSSAFEISSSWLPFPAFARPADADRRPGTAQALAVGTPREDSLDGPSGDLWDWFVIDPSRAGTMVAVLRALDDDLDLVLEVYSAGQYSEALIRSDQDLEGNTGNESATFDVSPGQKVYLKVAGAFSSAQGRYRLTASLLP